MDALPEPSDALLTIDEHVAIPRTELTYRATRSGGPGGQHVNTSATRVELTWNLETSTALEEAQRARLRERLASRLDTTGVLRLTASGSRSQHQNREDVTARFQRLLADALKERKVRRRTRTPRAAKEARLKAKRQRADRKRGRERPEADE